MVVQAIVDTENEMINSPKHYLRGAHEVIEVIEAWDLPFHMSTAVKYLARCGYKNPPKEEMEKCLWYLKRWQFVLCSRNEKGNFCTYVHLTKTKQTNGFGLEDILTDWQLTNTDIGKVLYFVYHGELQHAIDHLSDYIDSIE